MFVSGARVALAGGTGVLACYKTAEDTFNAAAAETGTGCQNLRKPEAAPSLRPIRKVKRSLPNKYIHILLVADIPSIP
jgi:hypothetical protein